MLALLQSICNDCVATLFKGSCSGEEFANSRQGRGWRKGGVGLLGPRDCKPIKAVFILGLRGGTNSLGLTGDAPVPALSGQMEIVGSSDSQEPLHPPQGIRDESFSAQAMGIMVLVSRSVNLSHPSQMCLSLPLKIFSANVEMLVA